MKSIAITKPDMATVGQNPNGLSCFGMLSELFIEELSARTRTSPGIYRPLALFYLDDGETTETPSAPPEISLNFDLKVVLDAIRRQNAEDNKRQAKNEKPSAPPVKKPEPPVERIIERILIRERELKISAENTQRIVLQSPRRRWEIGPMSLLSMRLKREAPFIRDMEGVEQRFRTAYPTLPATLVQYMARNTGAIPSATFAPYMAPSASRPTLPATLIQYMARNTSTTPPATLVPHTEQNTFHRTLPATPVQYPATLAQYASATPSATFTQNIHQNGEVPPLTLVWNREANADTDFSNPAILSRRAVNRNESFSHPSMQISPLRNSNAEQFKNHVSSLGTVKAIPTKTVPSKNRGIDQSTLRIKPLPLVSQAVSVPDSGGWTPEKAPVHPGMPMPVEKRSETGSILLPDVMRLRREKAMERQRTGQSASESAETSLPQWKRDIQQAVERTLSENQGSGHSQKAGKSAVSEEPDKVTFCNYSVGAGKRTP